MARRIMRRFILKEISGVDKPAQAHARAVIMKRDVRSKELNMAIDNEALALRVLDRAAEAIRKNNPALTKEQAFARAYTDPDNRVAALVEREASAARLAGVPVARLEPKILDSLDDDAINELAVEIKNANPWMTDAELIRAIAASAEERVEATDVGKALLADDDLLRLVDYERRLRPDLSDAAIYARVASSPAAREDRRAFHAMEAARRDDETAASEAPMDALTLKAVQYRKAHPDVTEAQAFAAVYTSRENRGLAKAERAANRPEG